MSLAVLCYSQQELLSHSSGLHWVLEEVQEKDEEYENAIKKIVEG